MKAAVLEKINTPLTVTDVGLSELQVGQVLVEMRVSGICGAQLQEIGGHKGNARFVPHLMGHEGCGIVAHVGAGVTKVKKGDKVVLHWRKGSGIESPFPTYIYKDKPMPSGKVTTFNEFSIVSENRVTPVPSDTPDDLCALLGCGLSTGLGVIEHEVKAMAGESILVAGVGGLGASIVTAAHIARMSPIVAIDIHAGKKKMALSLGADIFIDISKKDLSKEIAKIRPQGFDVVVETSGNAKSIASVLPLIKGGGRGVLVGQPKPGETVELTNAHHLFGGEGKCICATQGGQFNPDRDIPRYLNMYASGQLSIDALITHRVKLSHINKGIELMKSGKALRVMVDICQ